MFYCDINDDTSAGQNLSVKQYESEWRYLFNITSICELQNFAVAGELRTSRFRSICWRLLLKILPSDSAEWLSCIEKHRSAYQLIKLTHFNDPHLQDSGPDNPLSQDDHSVWKQYFKDLELKKFILQDVVRTSPGVEFFRTDDIQKIMIDILFSYSREYPDVCYKQGMHEILAPLLFVIHCDHQALLHVLEQSSSDVSDLIKKILNPDYLEADAYSLFSTIMEVMKDNYNISDNVMSSIVLEQSEAVKIASSASESEVVRKLSKIRDKMLMKHDPELYAHLMDLDISFTTFGVRWLRLLFGGEFSLMDLLVLWDTIFANSPQNFTIVNHIFVSMLVLIRVQLLKSDNTNCLNYLMRYPHVDVMSVIEYALHISDPKTFPLPSVIDALKRDNKRDSLKSNIVEDQPERPSKLVSNFPSRRSYNSSNELLELYRTKLLHYHSVLSPVVPNNNKEARQALSGILEICGMLNTRPGIVEMGKDVVQNTTSLQTPVTPESPGGPLLPPPASSITMKVFRKTESSTDSQILGAPKKNPLKQMKRFQQDYDNTIGISDALAPKFVQSNKVLSNNQENEKNIHIDKPCNNNNAVTIEEKKIVNVTKKSGNNDQQNLRYCYNNGLNKFIKLSDIKHNVTFKTNKPPNKNFKLFNRKLGKSKSTQNQGIRSEKNTNIVEQDKSCTNVKPKTIQQKFKHKLYKKPTCSYMCLIIIALKNSPAGIMNETEIFEFICSHFPYFKTTNELWRNSIRKCLSLNLYYIDSMIVEGQIFWYLRSLRIKEINQVIMTWVTDSPESVRESMSNPDKLKTSCGISLISAIDNCITEREVNNCLDEEELLTTDSDDNPFSEVTLTSEDVANMLNNYDQYQSKKSKQLQYNISYFNNSKNTVPKLLIHSKPKEKNQWINHKNFNNVKEVPEKVNTTWNQMSKEEKRPNIQESLQLNRWVFHHPRKQRVLEEPLTYDNNQPSYSQLAHSSNRAYTVNKVQAKKGLNKINKDKIKSPLRSFMLWGTKERIKIHNQMPHLSMGEISKILGDRWKQMTLEEKSPYIQEHKRLMDLYRRQNNHGYK